MRTFALTLVAIAGSAYAKTIVVTVGANTTANASTIFSPQNIRASVGDIIRFNFTLGNHTAIQSTFAAPCQPVHDTNSTVDGFNSGFRDTVNGTAVTQLDVPITADNNKNVPLWFYDFNTCAQGGVGGINANQSSNETIEGFVRNAIRLNGTNSTTSTTASGSSTASLTGSGSPSGTETGSAGGPSSTTSGAQRAVIFGGAALIPLFFLSALTL